MAALVISSNPTYQGVSYVKFLLTGLHFIWIIYLYTKIIHLYPHSFALTAVVVPEFAPQGGKVLQQRGSIKQNIGYLSEHKSINFHKNWPIAITFFPDGVYSPLSI